MSDPSSGGRASFGDTGPSSMPSYPQRQGSGVGNLTPREPGALSVVLSRVQTIRKNLESQTSALGQGLQSITGPTPRSGGQAQDPNQPPHLLGKLESELGYVEDLLAELAKHTVAITGLV